MHTSSERDRTMRTIDKLDRQERAAARHLFSRARCGMNADRTPQPLEPDCVVIEPHYLDDVIEGVQVDGLSLGGC